MIVETRNDLLKKQAERQDRMLDLLQHCSKISTGIDNLASNSGDRAIWELVQNAKDLSGECHICMKLTKDRFVFKHKGTPFNYETLTSLIKQVSSSEKQFREKNSDGLPKVGQYGTGFLTTHAFSRRIELKGCMEASLEGEPLCYVDLENSNGQGFEIDREFKDIKEFVEKMNKQIEDAQDLLYKASTPEPREWTELHYLLNETGMRKALLGLENARRLMPYVLAFNPTIKDVRMICDLDEEKYDITYSREGEETEQVASYSVVKTSVGITGQEPFEVYCLCSDDRTKQIVIPPTVFPDAKKTPSMFLFYPLLGTENFGTNFIFHSSSFTAKEERDGIMLPSGNENAKEKYEKNVVILNEMVEMLLDFLKKVVDERFSIADNESLARIYFPCSGNDDIELDEYFTTLKKKFVECFVTLPLLKTENEKVSIQSGNVKVFHPSLYDTLSSETLSQKIDVLKEYASLAYPIPVQKPLEWSRIIDEWGAGNDDYFITYQEICDSIKDKGDKLKQFLQLMQDAGQGELMAANPVIPNRKGKLCAGGSLQKAPTVTKQLYLIAEPLLGEKADKLVDPEYEKFIEREIYSRKNLREDMSTWLTEQKKEYVDKGFEFPATMIQALITFCSHYPSAGLNSFRNKMMPWIGKLYGLEKEECVLPSVEEKETDLYETPFGILMECALLTISKKNTEWVVENNELLYGILSLYLSMTEERWTEKLKKYAVIPNQNHQLCLLEKLNKMEPCIDSELCRIYKDVFGEDPRKDWVDERYAPLCKIDTRYAVKLAGDIQTELETRGYKDEAVLDIIELLEKKHWKQSLFDSINAQKEKLRYGFTTPEQRVHINKLIKAKNNDLLEQFATITENNDPALIVEMTKKAIADAEHQAYIKKLGAYVENHLLEYLKKRLASVGINVVDEQGGQDYIVSKAGFEDYRIEVKSRWSTDKSVEMSKLQFETAVGKPEWFALIMANMESFPDWRVNDNDPLKEDEIEEKLKVLDNIGNNEELYNRVEAAFRGGEDDIKADGSYTIRVPQAAFAARKLGLVEFVEILKGKFGE